METADYIAIIGWPITFVLGLLSSLVVQRATKKKKIIAWALVGESNILSEEVLTGFGVPIKVLVNNQEEANLSTIRVRIGNKGNIEITNAKIPFAFGHNAVVHVGQFISDIGTYSKKVRLSKQGNTAILEMDHINPGQSFDIEFLVGNYNIGDLIVDMAEPGVELRQTESTRWDFPKGIGESFVLDIFGFRIDPTARNTGLIVEEMRNLRKVLEKNIK